MSFLDDVLRDAAAEFHNDPAGVSLKYGTVTNVVSGASSDGIALVTVSVNGTLVAAPYLLSYASPANGQTVAVLTVNSVPLILGRVGGFQPV